RSGRITFALVPDGASDGNRYQRVYHGVVHNPRLRRPPRVTPLFCVGLDQAGVLCNATFRNPYLSRRTAPAHVDESDGNVKFLVQAASEIISHSTKACNALRSRNLPRPLSHRLRVVGP